MTIPEISEAEGLSMPHVAKLLMVLRKAGFISSTRGQAGGYTIARDPREIIVGDVLEALGGKLYDEGFCERHVGSNEICHHTADCAVRTLWESVQTAIDSVLNNITLDRLMKESNVEFHLNAPRREKLKL